MRFLLLALALFACGEGEDAVETPAADSAHDAVASTDDGSPDAADTPADAAPPDADPGPDAVGADGSILADVDVSDPGVPDVGDPDVASVDASELDLGGIDGPDAEPGPDAEEPAPDAAELDPDAAESAPDAAEPAPDAGVPRPQPAIAVPCDADDAAVYAAQAVDGPRGGLLACAPDGQVAQAEVQARLARQPDVRAMGGYQAFRIAYGTTRAPGVVGAGTGRLWVPTVATDGPRPVVVVTHGTVGLADRCAPSRGAPGAELDDLMLPWIAAGYVVVAPDYAGLGNAGVQGYAQWQDTARSVLDAGRAARDAVTPGSVDDAMVVAGHSQGGGAALAAQAFGRAYAPEIPIRAAVAYAGAPPISSTLQAFRFPRLVPLVGGAGVTRAVTAMALYADAANIGGEAVAGLAFHPDVRDVVVDAIANQCILGIVAALALSRDGYDAPRTLADLVDPDWRDQVVACDQRGMCSPAAEALVERARASSLPADPQGAPVLMLSGQDDIQQTLDRQACTRDSLVENGVQPTACVFAGADHFTLVESSAAFAVRWVQARLAGQPPPACPPGPAYPACD